MCATPEAAVDPAGQARNNSALQAIHHEEPGQAVIHLIKLCVGVSTIDDLVQWRTERRAMGLSRADGNNFHRTRSMPRRAEEIITEGGSLYWVIAGQIQCRQRIVALEAVQDADGRSCCEIVMDPEIVRTAPRPKRPFQGWRYLRPEDAPPDLRGVGSEGEMPPELAAELAELGLI